MQFESKIFKSVDIDPAVLNQQIDDYRLGDTYGYFLVDGKLVPKSLVAYLHDQLCDIVFHYGYVWSAEELLGKEIWSSLSESEQSVAGACLMIIIENGYFIPVPDEFELEH